VNYCCGCVGRSKTKRQIAEYGEKAGSMNEFIAGYRVLMVIGCVIAILRGGHRASQDAESPRYNPKMWIRKKELRLRKIKRSFN
jgi:hypothetical protein